MLKNLAADLLDGCWFNNDRNLQANYRELDKYRTQNNRYDCGLSAIHNTLATIKNLIDIDSFGDLSPDTDEIEQLRKSLDNQIKKE